MTEFPMSFLKYYFVRGHVFGGLMGFQYAMIISFFRFVRIVRMLQGSTKAGGASDHRLGAGRQQGDPSFD